MSAVEKKAAPAADSPLAVARQVLADPRKAYTVSTDDLRSICEALVDAADRPQPAITDDLAIAARALIAVHDGFADRAAALGITQATAVSDAVFKTFKTTFEEEFPND